MSEMTVFCNVHTKEFFFSTSSFLQEPPLEEWVPVTFRLPYHVVARPKVPDGLITTKEQYVAIFHDGGKEIPNPDPSFQASWPE